MLVEIQDQQFITAFYRDFCRRGVTGKFNLDALAQKHIEVYHVPEYGQSLEINIFVDDIYADNSIGLSWDPMAGARVEWYGPFNSALGCCELVALTTLVRRLLLKHGVIDARGFMVKRGVA